MILDHLTRRSFLQAGAAAGGGLVLSLSLPSANGDAEAADAAGVEQILERLAVAYESAKPYLVSRWRWPDRFNP